MTIPELLAREAAPCLYFTDPEDFWCSERVNWLNVCAACKSRPAIEAAVRKAIEACAKAVKSGMHSPHGHAMNESYARQIRALLDDPVEP